MDGLTYTITDSAAARQLTEDVRNLYAAVYAEAPYHEGPVHVRQFRRWWSDHLRRPGFAFAYATDGGRLLGVSYGYTMPGGDWIEPNADEPPALLRAAEKLLVPARRLYERMGWRQYGQIRPRSVPNMDVLVLRIAGAPPRPPTTPPAPTDPS
ncbi:hypothetical protein [Salinispora pacifica]|uniref:hypothetical protein n=1 Tax=Salinispora pacifica TaxID=351187 RepID=UPI000484CC6A|nr:hypothetical protein [Salinispora pacifica]